MLTEEQKAEGWKLLFDGKTTNGWHKYGGGPTGSAWKVADGMLYLDTSVKENWQIKDGGDIVTDDEYDNFHLKLEWKIAKDGNSGVIFYIHEDSAKYTWAWETGPEMQVLDNEGHPDAKIEKHRAGDLYDLISCSKETVRPAGEWNQVEVIADNGRLDFFLNNENVVSTTMWDDNWRKMIAGSKFADMPDFGTFKKGRIGLQDHGNMVWFKNVMIKKL
ncbi:MAG: DUF1080 domain-containing protein [Chitinophagales bacterium]|nr:DUF1080 domain-containing protein [Chitinophagales bacterium]